MCHFGRSKLIKSFKSINTIPKIFKQFHAINAVTGKKYGPKLLHPNHKQFATWKVKQVIRRSSQVQYIHVIYVSNIYKYIIHTIYTYICIYTYIYTYKNVYIYIIIWYEYVSVRTPSTLVYVPQVLQRYLVERPQLQAVTTRWSHLPETFTWKPLRLAMIKTTHPFSLVGLIRCAVNWILYGSASQTTKNW